MLLLLVPGVLMGATAAGSGGGGPTVKSLAALGVG